MTKSQYTIRNIIETLSDDFNSDGGTWSYSSLKQLFNNANKFSRMASFSLIEALVELVRSNHNSLHMYKLSQLLGLLKDKNFPFFSIALHTNIHKISLFFKNNSNDPLMVAATELFTKTLISVESEFMKNVELKNSVSKRLRNFSADKNKHPTFAQPVRANFSARRKIICYSPQPYISL